MYLLCARRARCLTVSFFQYIIMAPSLLTASVVARKASKKSKKKSTNKKKSKKAHRRPPPPPHQDSSSSSDSSGDEDSSSSDESDDGRKKSKKFNANEDIILTEAYISVSENTIEGVCKRVGVFWNEVLAKYKLLQISSNLEGISHPREWKQIKTRFL